MSIILKENNPLNIFLNETLRGPRSVYTDSRKNDLADSFAAHLGFRTRYTNGITRPDSDPKWTDIQWSAASCCMTGLVKNVRLMYIPHCYATSLEEMVKDGDKTFPNGEKIYDVITYLRDLRKKAKASVKSMRDLPISEKIEQGYLWCSDIVTLTKYLLNSIIYIFARYGEPTKIGAHHLREHTRNKVSEMIKQINKTATVIHVYFDHIVYVGDQVDIPGVHHETYDSAILIGDSGIAYGNNIQTDWVPRLCINRDTWNPNPTTLDEGRIEQFEKRLAMRTSRCKASVAAYLNRTKQDVEREIFVDNEHLFNLL